MYRFVVDAYPFYRCITGEGVRQTLRLVRETIPIEMVEVPTGTEVLDWTVPKEWIAREAYVIAPDGRRLFDMADHNLHLVGYSEPFRGTVGLDELKAHLHTLPDRPELIPHRTSYFVPTWGFCASQRQADSLVAGDYEVVIDAEQFDGSLTYGELVLPGDDEREVLLTTHVDHPSLANDNLSGIAALAEIARSLASVPHRYTYRFLFLPSMIGSITWLGLNPDVVERVHCGLVVTGLGDHGGLTYKRSRRGDTEIDRIAEVVVGTDHGARIIDWYPFGYDERQFCSPGFDLAVGRLSRSLHGTFPEYHTSGDDVSFVDPDQLVAATATVMEVLTAIDANGTFRNLRPYGEPRLGPRGLYGNSGGGVERQEYEQAVLWVLSLSDGHHDLVSIATASGLTISAIVEAADRLSEAGLLAPV
jgi:aminopeptidase-like protein